MQKLIENGFVATLHSSDWGTPWATNYPETMFDAHLIKLFLDWRELKAQDRQVAALKLEDRAYQYLQDNHQDVVFRGFEGLTVTWLLEGQEFQIREYDGIERLVLKEEQEWLVA
jgi:hypothetical protein